MTQTPIEGDDELLLRMQSGDEQAFLALYQRRHGALYRFALYLSGSTSVAEDIVQEVFLALIRDDCGFDPERGSLLAYLFGMARNMFLRQLHRVRGNVPLEEESDSECAPEFAETPDPLGDLTRKEGLEALRRAVNSLPPRYREVVVLCDLEEVDYADAASIVGCPIGTIRSRLHRAHALLADKMRQEKGARAVGAVLKPIRSLI